MEFIAGEQQAVAVGPAELEQALLTFRQRRESGVSRPLRIWHTLLLCVRWSALVVDSCSRSSVTGRPLWSIGLRWIGFLFPLPALGESIARSVLVVDRIPGDLSAFGR